MKSASETLAALLAACLFAGAAGAAEPLAIPGTRVSLEVPAGWKLSELFPGIVDTDAFSSVIVSEVPTPVAVMREALTREKLAAGGLTPLSFEQVQLVGRTGTLVHAVQNSRGNAYRKWILVFGDERATVSLIGSTPKVMEDRTGAAVRGALLSVRWFPDRQVDPFEGLGFALELPDDLRVTDRIANMLFVTRVRGGSRASANDPIFVIGTAKRFDRKDDLEQLARMRISQIEEVRDVRFGEGREIELDGLRAYELEASARDAETGAPVRVYQVLAIDDARTILLQGLVGEPLAERYLPQFRQASRSFRRTR